MSTQPAHQTRLPAKYTENSDDIGLTTTSHHKTGTSGLAVPQAPPSLVSTLIPMDCDVATSSDQPTQPSSPKQPSIVIDDDGDTTDTPEDTLKTKKLKKNSGQQVTGLQAKCSIISIDDVNDIKLEMLNKSDPTANIKEFFIPVPHVPGQEKGCMTCKLCQ
jgi:hypothetical protein